MIFSKSEILPIKGGEGLEQFFCKTKIISGPGAVAALGEMGIRKALVVTDPYFMENGQAQRIAKLSRADQTEIFHEITPDPSVELVAEGTAAFRLLKPDIWARSSAGRAYGSHP